MMIALYIIGGIVGWCVCSVINAYILKFFDMCSDADDDDTEILIAAGPLGLMWLLIILPLFAVAIFAEWLHDCIIDIPKSAKTKKVKQKKVKRTLLDNYNEFLQKD